ncbi:MAG: DUF2164 domain-containing protein [Desulfobacteraceae bacterium]|jgi:uncharacterized protein (DUF2164 family)
MPDRDAAGPMKINLSDERKQGILREFASFCYSEFDEEISEYRAEQVLEFFMNILGPTVYNQAIQDARAFISEKLEDLDAEFFINDSFDM